MTKSINQITIQHRDSISIPVIKAATKSLVPVENLVAFATNLEALGYRLSRELFVAAQNLSKTKFNIWAEDVLISVKTLKGATYTYKPMYPNFPEQVAEASEVELYLNAIAHYYGDLVGLRIMPTYDSVVREPIKKKNTKYVTLDIIVNVEKELTDLFVNLINSKVVLSESIKKDIVVIAKTIPIPLVDNISNKENAAFYVGLIRATPTFVGYIDNMNNPTDLLRIVAVLGGTSPSLVESVNFGKLTKLEQKLFVNRLNNFTVEQLNSAFSRNQKLWKKFARHIHAGDYSKKALTLTQALNNLYSNQLADVFVSEVEKTIKEGDIEKVIAILSQRPSILVRRAYELLTKFDNDTDVVLNSLIDYASLANTQVLAQALGRFTSKPNTSRVVYSKSLTTAPTVISAGKNVNESVNELVATILRTALINNLKTRDSLGKVYLSENVDEHAIPFGFRSASDSFKLLGRGSQLSFDMDETLRFFLHWKDIDNDGYAGRVDIDLSAVILDENFQIIDRISYYNLATFGGVHSGDITSAPNGAAEFIDIKPRKVLAANSQAKYVSMSVISYTGQKFSDIPEAIAGFMTRKGNTQKGEIFDGRTVENVYKVNSNSCQSIPFLFDLVTGKAIWVDLATSVEKACQNVDNSAGGTGSLLEAVINRNILTVETLFELHAAARATEIVDTADEADIVLDYNNFTFDEIISEWL